VVESQSPSASSLRLNVLTALSLFRVRGTRPDFSDTPQQTGKNDYSLCHPANVFVRETRLFRDNHLGMEGVAVSIMPGAYP
jgi:hypothetical protein